MALISLVLALMVPREPEPGNESLIFRVLPILKPDVPPISKPGTQPAE